MTRSLARGECVHHHRNVEHRRGDAETDGGQDGACARRRQQEPGDVLIGHGAAAGEADDSAEEQSDQWHEQRRSDQSDCHMRRSEGHTIGERSAEMRRDFRQRRHRLAYRCSHAKITLMLRW